MRIFLLSLVLSMGVVCSYAGTAPMDTTDNWQIYLNGKIIGQGCSGLGVQLTLSRSSLKPTDMIEIHYHTCTFYQSKRVLQIEYGGVMHKVYTSPGEQSMGDPIRMEAYMLLEQKDLPEKFNLYLQLPDASVDNKSGWLGEIILTP